MAKKSLEERIQRLEDIEEIKQLMSKYSYLLSACRMKDLVELFSKRDDATACCGDWGLFRGAEGISNQFIGTCPEGGLEGFMSVHMMTTHIIEVAGDGKTAKGVWMSPGHETYDKKMAGRVIPTWGWGKYAADFIKEGGEWKIWHYWNFPDFTVEYEKGWASGGKPEFLQAIDIVLDLKPDAPTPYPLTLYDPDRKPQFLPAFPEPRFQNGVES